MKTKIFITLTFIFITSNIYSQSSSFIPLNPLPTYKNLKFISNFENTIYICGDDGSIFKSSNYGTNWINISFPFQTSLASIRFFNKDTGYVSGNNPTYSAYTTNGGYNWINYNGPVFTDLEFVKSNVGYGIINNVAPRKTTNAGINWQIDSNILYQGSNSKYFTSIKFIDEFTGYISEVSNPTNTTKILKTTNGGLNWILNTTLNSRIYSINLLNKDTIVVFGKIGSEKYVTYSTNQGVNWISNILSGIHLDPIVCWDGEVGILSSNGDGDIYVSYNLGQFWTPFSQEYITDLIKLENNLYSVGFMGEIYKSSDGNNWTDLRYSEYIGVRFYDKYNSENIYFSNSDGIYRFDTLIYKMIFDNRILNSKVYYQYSPTKMVKIKSSRKYVSTNNGQTWNQGVNQYINEEIIGLYYYSERNGVAVSRYGTIWKDTTGGYGQFHLLHTPADYLKIFIPVPKKNKLIVLSENGERIHYSDSTGNNWHTQNISINTGLSIVNSVDSIIIASDNLNRLHYSSNYGENWKQIYQTSGGTISAITLRNSKIYNILINNNSTTTLLTTTNSGLNWTANFTSNSIYTYIDHTFPGYMFIGGGLSRLSFSKNGGYYTPLNYSANFFPEAFIGNFRIFSYSELPSVDIKRTQLSSDRNFNNILFDTSFIGTQLNISNSCALEYNSKRYTRVKINRGGTETEWKVDSVQIPGKSNTGQWFTIRNDEIAKQRNNKIIFSDSLNGLIVSDSGRIFKTNKSGICWEKYQFNTNSNLNDLLNYDLSVLFLCGDSGKIYKSTNSGLIWENISLSDSIKLISMNKYGSDIFIISQNGQIYKSTNLGTSWNISYSDSVNIFNSIVSSNNNIFVCGNNGLILRSVNNGVNWQNISLPNNLNLKRIQIFSEKIFISADSGSIFVSVNDGLNFNLIQTPISKSINEIYAFENSIYASCNNSTILKSINSGLNWLISTKQINNEYNNLNSLSIINNKELWAVGDRNSVVYVPNISILSNMDSFQQIVVNDFKLYQNYPNPFNPETTISFDIPEKLNVRLKIINILGQEIAVLVRNESLISGRYNYKFNGKNFPSGIYFYILETDKFKEVKKMVLIK